MTGVHDKHIPIRHLKHGEPLPSSSGMRIWSYRQWSGKNRRINLLFCENGVHKATILIRPDSIYFSSMAQVDMQTMEEAIVLMRQALERLTESETTE